MGSPGLGHSQAPSRGPWSTLVSTGVLPRASQSNRLWTGSGSEEDGGGGAGAGAGPGPATYTAPW